MLMAAVVPRDTVVTYKPPKGSKVNLSTADHVTLADTGELRPLKGETILEEELSVPVVPAVRSQQKASCRRPNSPSSASSVNQFVAAELSSSTGSLSSLCHVTANGSVAHLARAAITRANTLRATNGPLKSSTSSSSALDQTGGPAKAQGTFTRTSSLGSESEKSHRASILSNATEEVSLAIPLDEEDEEDVDDPRVAMLRSNSINFTPLVVTQQPPSLDQHGSPRPISPAPPNLQLRRSGLMSDRSRRANYRAAKNVSFDCETRTETFETELTESETDEREFVRLMGHYDRRPHVRLPLSLEEEYQPPGKEEEDFLPKMLCFALALVITGGILYGLHLLISHMNINLFGSA